MSSAAAATTAQPLAYQTKTVIQISVNITSLP